MLFKNLIMKLGEDSKLETMKLWWNYETWRRLQKSIKRATTMIVLDKEGSNNDCNLLVSTMSHLSIFWASCFRLFVSLREECFVMKYHWLFTVRSHSFSSEVWLAGKPQARRNQAATGCLAHNDGYKNAAILLQCEEYDTVDTEDHKLSSIWDLQWLLD